MLESVVVPLGVAVVSPADVGVVRHDGDSLLPGNAAHVVGSHDARTEILQKDVNKNGLLDPGTGFLVREKLSDCQLPLFHAKLLT